MISFGSLTAGLSFLFSSKYLRHCDESNVVAGTERRARSSDVSAVSGWLVIYTSFRGIANVHLI